MTLHRQHAFLFSAVAIFAGCYYRFPYDPPVPRFHDPRNIAKAMELYDRNRDGGISGDELNQAPGLRAALPRLNTDAKRGITAKQLTARLQRWDDSGVGGMFLKCTITHNGKPLEGALVKFIPEKFLWEMLTETGLGADTATGTTDQAGVAVISARPLPRPDGIPPSIPLGMYRVEITKDGEEIPARYNSATELGQEIATDSLDVQTGVNFNLEY
jgi:hypothetical protein